MPRVRQKPRAILVVLALLSGFAPISTDLYLPAVPQLTGDLDTTDAATLATLSAFMIGLAAGQLVIGPASDRFGRRAPMLLGVTAYAVVSLLCALAPTIEALVALRALQGFAGSCGVVIARAIVRDTREGPEAARAFSVMGAIQGITPVIAPGIGGAILLVTDWRGVFFALAGVGVAMFGVAWFCVDDTLDPAHRARGGVRAQWELVRDVVRNRHFVVILTANALAGLGLFSYIQMSSTVMQGQYGLSPQAFSLVFTANACGIVLGTFVNRRLLRRGIPVQTLGRGSVGIAATGSVVLLALALAQAPLWALMLPLFVIIATHGSTVANNFALALAPFERGAGTASAVLGAVQFLVAAVVPPLAALGGASAVVMALTMASGTTLAFGILSVRRRR